MQEEPGSVATRRGRRSTQGAYTRSPSQGSGAAVGGSQTTGARVQRGWVGEVVAVQAASPARPPLHCRCCAEAETDDPRIACLPAWPTDL